MTVDRIEREIAIAAPIERVWAVIEAAHLGAWFGNGGPAEIDLWPGGRIAFNHGPHGPIPARIEKIDRPHHFSYRWVVIGSDEEPADGNSTLADFTLTEDSAGTLLRMVESGFTGLSCAEDLVRQRYEANSAGLPRILQALRRYTEQLVP
jgi:uncharacterized protein YndB with AHSA1/START domain